VLCKQQDTGNKYSGITWVFDTMLVGPTDFLTWLFNSLFYGNIKANWKAE